MYLLYLIALIPIIFAIFLFLFNKRIVWLEWVGGTILALVYAGIMHSICIFGMTDDIETLSGRVNYVSYFPQWTEEYKVAIYKTETYYTGTGKNRQMHTKRVFSHYETRHDTHREYWMAYMDFGRTSGEKEIDYQTYLDIKNKFGNVIKNAGTQSTHHSSGHFDGGDNNIYESPNVTQYIHPVTTKKHFENRVKAAPTTFSFIKIPKEMKGLYEYPENNNIFISNRLLGNATKQIDILCFDQMNAVLGPTKKVNVIIVGFDNVSLSIANYQEAKWVGGKKNDLVICYGVASSNKAQWVKVFGWTEKELVKQNIETIFLNNTIDNNILSLIQTEIIKNYQIKDWSKFDYISIEPSTRFYIIYIVLLIITQSIFWVICHKNEFEKS